MSILIKGMDMPEIGENVEHVWVPGWIEVGKDGKAIFCTGIHFDPNAIRSYPIEEVSTPHGRLIDADALLKTIEANDYMLCSALNTFDRGMFTIGIQQAIDEAPTIVEAEGKS